MNVSVTREWQQTELYHVFRNLDGERIKLVMSYPIRVQCGTFTRVHWYPVPCLAPGPRCEGVIGKTSIFKDRENPKKLPVDPYRVLWMSSKVYDNRQTKK